MQNFSNQTGKLLEYQNKFLNYVNHLKAKKHSSKIILNLKINYEFC
jgi:hypothetical protein